jgi:glycosyltransferase involved in cell wall biosynthesis
MINNLPPPTNKQAIGWPWTEEGESYPPTLPDGSPWPKISIVTPSYNQASFIEETIRSVLLQNYPNLEYILIDGASKDGSMEIIQKYAPWLSYWVSEPDQGQSNAINKGFAKATGQILAWINSDDYYQPGALRTAAEVLYKSPKSLAAGAGVMVDASTHLKGKHLSSRIQRADLFYEAATIIQPCAFWTKDLWNVVGPLDEGLYYVMDYDLWLRMFNKADNVFFRDEILSHIYLHPNQKSQFPGNAAYTQELCSVSLRGAYQRGEKLGFWLMKMWTRRFFSAVKTRKLYKLKGSDFHRAITKAYFHGNYKIV